VSCSEKSDVWGLGIEIGGLSTIKNGRFFPSEKKNLILPLFLDWNQK
jgi:hypothetical protein